MNKKKFIILLIIFILVAAFTVTKITLDFNKESKIKNEISEIGNKLENNENISEILDRRVIKKGPYSEVEKSIKLYYKNIYSSLDNLNFLLDNDNFSNYLSSKNLNEDKPSFIKSKSNLQNSKAQIDENYNKLINELNNETSKLTYLTSEDLKSYYRTFYLELTKIGIKEELINKIETRYKEITENIATYNEIFDFLAANKGHWIVQNEAIVFDNTITYEEYVNITKKLNSNSLEENEEVSEN